MPRVNEVLESNFSEVIHLYVDEKLSTYEIGRMHGIPPSTIAKRLKKLGIIRSYKEAGRIVLNNHHKLTFTCRLCSRKLLLNELVSDDRYFPPVYCCKKCAGY